MKKAHCKVRFFFVCRLSIMPPCGRGAAHFFVEAAASPRYALCTAAIAALIAATSRFRYQSAASSEPHRVPMGVVADVTHEPCTQRIGDKVACGGLQVFVATQRVIVEPRLPQRRAGGVGAE